jgi:hypothetical protein
MVERSTKISVVLIWLLCSGCLAWGQESAGLRKIRIGMPNRGVPNLGLMAAQRYGFFRGFGLDAELIVMRPAFRCKH